MGCKLLIEESPLQVQPTLATWLGLNEAIFVQQLHYILTQNKTVGKTVDGRHWYRDKPQDFIVKYFPFWDEGVIKRVITNLRKDNIILARSDLNKIPKDRSLWYSINYAALERLDGPVERLQDKHEKRKAARLARGDTKEQNVLLTNDGDEGEPKAQKDAQIDEVKSTKCTDRKVQNVPTPKELLPKDKSVSNETDGKISPLLPDTPQTQHLFEQLGVEFHAKGRRRPKKFPSLACKKKFDESATRLNGSIGPAVTRAFEKGILSVSGVVDFIAKWQLNGANHGHQSTNQRRSHRGQRKPQVSDPAAIRAEIERAKQTRSPT